MNNEENQSRIPQLAFEKAYHCEATYGNCAQCVLHTIQELFDLGHGSAFKAATGFAGGICRLGSMCGAFSGGVMALGLLYGRSRIEDLSESYYTVIMDLVRVLSQRFEEEFGGILCPEVELSVFGRSFDHNTEYELFEAAGAHVDKCPRVAGNAAKWVAELIIEQEYTT